MIRTVADICPRCRDLVSRTLGSSRGAPHTRLDGSLCGYVVSFTVPPSPPPVVIGVRA